MCGSVAVRVCAVVLGYTVWLCGLGPVLLCRVSGGYFHWSYRRIILVRGSCWDVAWCVNCVLLLVFWLVRGGVRVVHLFDRGYARVWRGDWYVGLVVLCGRLMCSCLYWGCGMRVGLLLLSICSDGMGVGGYCAPIVYLRDEVVW